MNTQAIFSVCHNYQPQIIHTGTFKAFILTYSQFYSTGRNNNNNNNNNNNSKKMNTESIIALIAIIVAIPPTFIVLAKCYYFVRKSYWHAPPPPDEERAIISLPNLREQRCLQRQSTVENLFVVVAVTRRTKDEFGKLF
ncbi:hypothetical protein QBC38DRAFT_73310 [Podospora fimiseda]|uniref:Uncharacterized protein n=1 Tax=Podospora fimiseda TaxID=252190 RepID=A0AAN6YQA6_9PEZI|nr:hypothetical protein QBC38DRAFT_73310 [Podospora fimiseda]